MEKATLHGYPPFLSFKHIFILSLSLSLSLSLYLVCKRLKLDPSKLDIVDLTLFLNRKGDL